MTTVEVPVPADDVSTPMRNMRKWLDYMRFDALSLLLPQEVADHLRMRVQTLANWRCYGGGPELGNRIFYPMSKLQAFVKIYSSTSEYSPPTDGAPA
jgi:hypothetical protein